MRVKVWHVFFTLVIAGAASFAACGDNATSEGDSGNNPEFGQGTCPEGTDPSSNSATAFTPSLDTLTEEYICPRGDVDFYQVDVPAGQLLNIDLEHTSSLTNLRLSYDIRTDDSTLVVQGPDGQSNDFNVAHCLDAGTYFVVVQGDNSTFDSANKYNITLSNTVDPDTNEPNNDQATASAITSGNAVNGNVSCAGDVDFYSLGTVNKGKLIKVDLTTADTTTVDLKYTLYRVDGTTLVPLGSDAKANGEVSATTLEAIYAASTQAEYLVAVEDDVGDDSDITVPYSLTVEVLDDNDPNELNGSNDRNDHPSTAKLLTNWNGASCVTLPAVKGRLNAIGDVDYYRIDAPSNITTANSAVMEIEVRYSTPTFVDPAFSFVYRGSDTCSDDGCCAVQGGPSCNGDPFECTASSFNCAPKGQGFCDACETSPGATCPTDTACSGASVCADGQCGITQFNRLFESDGTTAPSIRTAQPMIHGGPWFIRVSDFQTNEYDFDAEYDLLIRICPEPDAFETNNGYFPRLVEATDPACVPGAEVGLCDPDNPSNQLCCPKPDSPALSTSTNQMRINDLFNDEGSTNRTNQNINLQLPVMPATMGPWSNMVQGHISYMHDEDFFDLGPSPCDATDCPLTFELGMIEDQPGACADMELLFQFDLPDNDLAFTKSSTGTELVGFAESPSVCRPLKMGAGNIRLRVSERLHNRSSVDCRYTVRLRIDAPDCAAPCIQCAATNECEITCSS